MIVRDINSSMANKKISDFPVTATLGDDDIFLIDQSGSTSSVAYKTVSTSISGLVTNSIQTIIDNLNPTNEDKVDPAPEQGFIKQLAKMRPSKYNVAAITSTNRVITWGASNGTEASKGGKLSIGFASSNRTSPERYIRVPFHANWTTTGGPTGIDYLDEYPNVKILDLYWNAFGAMALLDDGSCWVAGYNSGGLGVGADPGNPLAGYRPTGGFVKVAFSTPGTFIKRIECSSDNTALNGIFAALDSTDSLWVWGTTADGVFGTADLTLAETISTPRKLTSMTIVDFSSPIIKNYTSGVAFENEIFDFSINSTEATGTAISVVLKNNKLYISGDNSKGQRGTGFTTGSGLFNQAKTAALTYVENAVAVERGIYSGFHNHYYISTSGAVWACGRNISNYSGGSGNDISWTGNNSFVSTSYFVSTTWPSNMIAEKILTVGYDWPTVFALCKDSTTDTKTVYSWGYNHTIGNCGTNSTAFGVNVPTQVVYRAGLATYVALNNVVDIFVSDNTGTSTAVCIVDKEGYAYTAGANNYNDPPLFLNANTQFFIRVPLKNVVGAILGGDVGAHRWNIFLLKNGTTWGMGDAAELIFGGSDLLRHPARLI